MFADTKRCKRHFLDTGGDGVAEIIDFSLGKHICRNVTVQIDAVRGAAGSRDLAIGKAGDNLEHSLNLVGIDHVTHTGGNLIVLPVRPKWNQHAARCHTVAKTRLWIGEANQVQVVVVEFKSQRVDAVAQNERLAVINIGPLGYGYRALL